MKGRHLRGASSCGKPHPKECVVILCSGHSDKTDSEMLDEQAPGATGVLGILYFLKLLLQKLAKCQLFSRATQKDEIDHHYDNHEQLHLGNSNGK